MDIEYHGKDYNPHKGNIYINLVLKMNMGQHFMSYYTVGDKGTTNGRLSFKILYHVDSKPVRIRGINSGKSD
mgnify:CR=1 FL=1